ncbi:Coiled-coil domain-containing protein 142 [Trinorchestia longiramus]|nr:Coiled-coil domain-containing protein 142 [Trinorchestia longiramus]
MAVELHPESCSSDHQFDEFSSRSCNFVSGSHTLLRALRHIYRGLQEENLRLPKCCFKARSIVIHRHEEVMLKVVKLLKSYAMNFLDLHLEFVELSKVKRYCSSPAKSKARHGRQTLMLQRDAVLHVVDKIVFCQLRFMSQQFNKSSDSLEGVNVFKVIKCYNLILEKLKRCSEADVEFEESKPDVVEENIDPCVPSTSSLTVPTIKKKQPDPPPPPRPIEKLKVRLTPEPMIAPSSQLKKFTASRILHSIGSVRCGYVTEYIAEALLSRIDVPAQNGHYPKMNLPWKPVSFSTGSSGKSHLDIFEEALAKEENENTLNQKKLDMALRQEFGEDFPGTDYLPSSECGDALKPISSPNMARLIKTNTSLLQLLFKKFLNTPGVLVPSLVKFGRYGEHRLSKAGRARLEGYYVDQIWGVGSNLVDELLLWSPLLLVPDSFNSTGGPAIPGVRAKDGARSVLVVSTHEVADEGVLTPMSEYSTGSSASSETTVISSSRAAGDSICLRPAGQSGRGTRFRTLNVSGLHIHQTSSFLAPPALNNSYLLYLQDALQKYSRRGVLPGWCVDACEGLVTECGHVLGQSYLDRNLIVAFGAYARRQPPPLHLSGGNYSTGGGIGLSNAVEQLVWQVNQIEKTEPEKEDKDWPIAELIESLSVLCSVCSSGLCWLQLRSQSVLHTWTTAPYYLLTQADLPHILIHFSKIALFKLQEEYQVFRMQEEYQLFKLQEEYQVFRMQKEYQVFRMQKEYQVFRMQKEYQVFRMQEEYQVFRMQEEYQVFRMQEEYQVFRMQEEYQVFRMQEEYQVFRMQEEYQVFRMQEEYQIEEREYLVKTDVLQRALLVPYRDKLVARTEALLAAAKREESMAVEAVSQVCRTVALAQLQNAMPPPSVWRGVGRLPHEPHAYVAEYIGCVLQPVLDAVSQLGEELQRRAGSAVLKVVCYAWLEHIRAQKIKFSLWGAQQLLKDFAALSEWVRAYPGLCAGAREQVLAVDVLRECEGVARLLMRQPPLVVGYSSLNQVAPLTAIKAGMHVSFPLGMHGSFPLGLHVSFSPDKHASFPLGREHDKSVRLGGEQEDIPAEMYVPNQGVWLGRRTRPASSVCVRSASCCSWPY